MADEGPIPLPMLDPVESSDKPLTGMWQPGPGVQRLFYGSGCVGRHLVSALPSPESRVFVVTGKTITHKTPLIQDLQEVLQEKLAGLFEEVQEHVPLEGVHDATEVMEKLDDKIDTILAIGGGSPIDFAKVLSVQARANPALGPFTIIAIPTTLSAAESSMVAYYTRDDIKVEYQKRPMLVKTIFYDPEYAQYTPKTLWLSSGICAIDHAVETMYDHHAPEYPTKAMAIWAVKCLFDGLKEMSADWPGTRDQMTRLFLAAYASNANSMKSRKMANLDGLSHLFNFALASPFGIPNGIASCITLGEVVKYKAIVSKDDAKQIARLLPSTGSKTTGDPLADGCQVGKCINLLVIKLGLHRSLDQYGITRNLIPDIASHIAGPKGNGDITEGDCRELVARFFH